MSLRRHKLVIAPRGGDFLVNIQVPHEQVIKCGYLNHIFPNLLVLNEAQVTSADICHAHTPVDILRIKQRSQINHERFKTVAAFAFQLAIVRVIHAVRFQCVLVLVVVFIAIERLL